MGDLSNCLHVTLRFEGGFSDNPKDPGGATMNGVTLATFRRYRPNATVADLQAMSPEVRQVIYSDGYWRPIAGDTLADGVDLAAFDYAVNSGVGAAQKALVATAGKAPVDRVKAICARRLSILQSLKTWRTFGRGWGSRVAQVQALAIKMAAGVNAGAELQKAAAQETSRAQVKARAAKVTGAGAPVALFGPMAAPQLAAPTAVNGAALYIVAAVLLATLSVWAVIRARQHEAAAAALTAAAKEA